MTTIAYRDGIMAADSGAWHGNATHRWARKLAKGDDGTLYGVTGNAAECHAFLAWVDAGCHGEPPTPVAEGPNISSFNVLIAPPDGPIRLRTACGDEVYDAPYFATGGGAATAYGAMYAGATAATAIKATIEHGECAHGDVNIICHPLKGMKL